MTKERKHERFRVNLQVKFTSAVEFVTQYAENISASGLFVAGVTDLVPLSEVEVDIVLPGHGCHTITARVAHILTQDVADKIGCAAGAGMEITKSPSGFRKSLSEYLMFLGKRRSALVWATDPTMCEQLAVAGYGAKLFEEGATGKPIAIVTDERWEGGSHIDTEILRPSDVDSAIQLLDDLLRQTST